MSVSPRLYGCSPTPALSALDARAAADLKLAMPLDLPRQPTANSTLDMLAALKASLKLTNEMWRPTRLPKAYVPSNALSMAAGRHAPPIDMITSKRGLLECVVATFKFRDILALPKFSDNLWQRLDTGNDASTGLRGALVMQALAQTGAVDIDEATSVLDRVGTLDFDAPRATPVHADGDAKRAVHTERAWRVARILARSADGFAALQALRAAAGRPAADAWRGKAVRVLLQATDALDPTSAKAADQDPSLAAVARRALGDSQRITADACTPSLAARALDAAATWLERGSDALTPDQKGVLFAWLQGFREDGRGTDLSHARERLHKFVAKTALRDRDHRWSDLILRVAGKRKAPLAALRLDTSADRKRWWNKLASYIRGAHNASTSARSSAISAEPQTQRRTRPPVARDLISTRLALKELAITGDPDKGHLTRLSDGGQHGLSSETVSLMVRNGMSAAGMFLSPALDARISRRRDALVELRFAEHGASLFVGTATTMRRQVGLGMLVGYSLLPVTMGASLSGIPYAPEISKRRGVTLDVARRLKPDGSGYDDDGLQRKMAELVDHLFADGDETGGPASGRGAQATWNRLATRYFDDPDLSVGWMDDCEKNDRESATVGASVSLALPGAGVSPAVIASLGRESEIGRLESVSRSGRMQIQRYRAGNAGYLKASAGLRIAEPNRLQDNASVRLAITPSILRPWEKTLKETGETSVITLVREDGKLNPQACTLDVQFVNPDDYAKEIGKIRQILDKPAATSIASQRPGVTAPASAGHAHTIAKQHIDAHLKQVQDERRDGQTYLLRYRLRDSAAARINALEARAAQARDEGEHSAKVQQQTKAKRDNILHDPQSWTLDRLIIREQLQRTKGPLGRFKLNLILDVDASTSRTDAHDVAAVHLPVDGVVPTRPIRR